jgi:hypothetical protein
MSNLEEELFKTVYDWGRAGIVVDSQSPYYKKLIKQLITEHTEEVIKDYQLMVE